MIAVKPSATFTATYEALAIIMILVGVMLLFSPRAFDPQPRAYGLENGRRKR